LLSLAPTPTKVTCSSSISRPWTPSDPRFISPKKADESRKGSVIPASGATPKKTVESRKGSSIPASGANPLGSPDGDKYMDNSSAARDSPLLIPNDAPTDRSLSERENVLGSARHGRRRTCGVGDTQGSNRGTQEEKLRMKIRSQFVLGWAAVLQISHLISP